MLTIPNPICQGRESATGSKSIQVCCLAAICLRVILKIHAAPRGRSLQDSPLNSARLCPPVTSPPSLSGAHAGSCSPSSFQFKTPVNTPRAQCFSLFPSSCSYHKKMCLEKQFYPCSRPCKNHHCIFCHKLLLGLLSPEGPALKG